MDLIVLDLQREAIDKDAVRKTAPTFREPQ